MKSYINRRKRRKEADNIYIIEKRIKVNTKPVLNLMAVAKERKKIVFE